VTNAYGVNLGEFLLPPLKKQPVSDYVFNYSVNIIELGFLLKSLLHLIENPDRDRGLRILKLSMLFFKAHKTHSKYSNEIMRFLMHQLSTLSTKKAYEEFYGLFVNTVGKIDTHIPCDLCMEHVVKEVKWNIKHMCGGLSEEQLEKRTGAICGLREIGENFDRSAGVIIRNKQSSFVTDAGDELEIIEQIIRISPFSLFEGRTHMSFKNMQKSVLQKLDIKYYNAWVTDKIEEFAFETGN
jgi:hypothetical protein